MKNTSGLNIRFPESGQICIRPTSVNKTNLQSQLPQLLRNKERHEGGCRTSSFSDHIQISFSNSNSIPFYNHFNF